jgi:competence protein ComFC
MEAVVRLGRKWLAAGSGLARDGAVRLLFRRLGESCLSLLYPPQCAQCAAETVAGEYLCDGCAGEAKRIVAPFCRGCSEPFAGAITGAFLCGDCKERDFQFTCAVSPYRATGVVREFIHRFKYQRHFYLRHPLAEWLAAGLEDERLREPALDFLVPVPLHRTREREREFNQAQVLAELLSARAGVPTLAALKRVRYTTTQTRLDRARRMENLRGAFCLKAGAGIAGRHLLLIDDVFTTGSTAEECARVLHRGGVASVRVLTVARAL